MKKIRALGEGWLLAVSYILVAVALWWREAPDIAWFDFILFGLILVVAVELRMRLAHMSYERIATKCLDIIGDNADAHIRLTASDGTPRLEMYRPGIPATTGPPAVFIEIRRDGSYIEVNDGGTRTEAIGPGIRVYVRSNGEKWISITFPPPATEENVAPDQLHLEVAQRGVRLLLREWDYDQDEGSERVLWKSA